MKIEIDRSALLVETRRFAFTLVWPWGRLPGWCDFPDDKRFGWTSEDDGGAASRETRFSFGRFLGVFAWAQVTSEHVPAWTLDVANSPACAETTTALAA